MAPGGVPEGKEAFRDLFEAHRDRVFRFLFRLSGNAADAEDLLQETFVRFWRKREQFRGDGSIEGYLRSIAYRTFLNARTKLDRARARRPLEVEMSDGGPEPAERAASRDLNRYLLDSVRREVDRLPDSWREPFVMFRFEGLPCARIAELMGISRKAVEMRLSKALRRISERLQSLRAEHGAPPARRRGRTA